jgi:phosphoribosylformylglycinamidine cyclo-ligase
MSTADRYRAAGVDLDAAARTKQRIVESLASTKTALSHGHTGAFGGMIRMPDDVPQPTLVMSTDGVGTKVLVAVRAGRHDTVGQDLVNHCVNDILVHGARPLAFLDYIAAADIDAEMIAVLVEGVARGCRDHEMTLVGGETAQLPELYQPGHYDLAGTIVGVVSEKKALHGDHVRQGDTVVGYASSGLHTNGYTLARQIVFDELQLAVDSEVADLNMTVADALLAVHRSYWHAVAPALPQIHALAHITGGGIRGNLRRSLPPGRGAELERGAWKVPPLFAWLEDAGGVSREEMFSVFNMGLGMIAIVPAEGVREVRETAEKAGVETWEIGEIVAGQGVQIR